MAERKRKRGRKIVPTEFIDLETGEKRHANLVEKAPSKSCFLGGTFMQVGVEAMRLLRRERAPASMRLVIDWLLEHTEDGNKIYNVTHAMIARECVMMRPEVTLIMQELKRATDTHGRLIRKLADRGAWALNPRYWYHGTLEEQKKACAQWDRWELEDLNREVAASLEPATATVTDGTVTLAPITVTFD